MLTRSQLRGSSWRRIWPDLHVHRDVEVTHALRARAAAGLLIGDSVVTGVSAAVLWGVEPAGPDADVELTVPPGRDPVRVAGLPPARAQFTVRDADGFVARVDFAWPEHRVAVEYDGLWHAEPGQFARDRRRLNRLQAAGWTVVFVTAGDLHRPAEVLARIRAALRSS